MKIINSTSLGAVFVALTVSLAHADAQTGSSSSSSATSSSSASAAAGRDIEALRKDMQALASLNRLTDARTAIEQGQFDQAIAKLSTLIKQFEGRPEFTDPSNRIDAALYWKAYSEGKQKQVTEALATVDIMMKKFAESGWLKDAMALAVELKQSTGQTVSPDAQPDEELKLLALRGLMQSDPDRAIPMVEQLLAGNSSAKLKENALFVLTQSRSPKSGEIIAGVVKNPANPELQLRAIRYLGAMKMPGGSQILDDAYRASSDDRVKRAIIRSFMVAGDRTRIVAIAQDTAASNSVRSEAIQQLGVMKADDELARMYTRETTPELKRRIINGIFVSNNAGRLVEMARAEKDPAMKKEIVQKLSLMRSKEATDYMLELLK